MFDKIKKVNPTEFPEESNSSISKDEKEIGRPVNQVPHFAKEPSDKTNANFDRTHSRNGKGVLTKCMPYFLVLFG